MGDAVRCGGTAPVPARAVAAATLAFIASIFARAASAGDCVVFDAAVADFPPRMAAARALAAAICSWMLGLLEGVCAGEPLVERGRLLPFEEAPSFS